MTYVMRVRDIACRRHLLKMGTLGRAEPMGFTGYGLSNTVPQEEFGRIMDLFQFYFNLLIDSVQLMSVYFVALRSQTSASRP